MGSTVHLHSPLVRYSGVARLEWARVQRFHFQKGILVSIIIFHPTTISFFTLFAQIHQHDVNQNK